MYVAFSPHWYIVYYSIIYMIVCVIDTRQSTLGLLSLRTPLAVFWYMVLLYSVYQCECTRRNATYIAPTPTGIVLFHSVYNDMNIRRTARYVALTLPGVLCYFIMHMIIPVLTTIEGILCLMRAPLIGML